jgi:hypothetical protein
MNSISKIRRSDTPFCNSSSLASSKTNNLINRAPPAALPAAAFAEVAPAAVRTDTAAVFTNTTVAKTGHVHAELAGQGF